MHVKSVFMGVFKAILFTTLLLSGFQSQAQVDYTVLAYHDVVPTKTSLYGDAITTETLVNHFEWMLSKGYHPVSLQQILDHRAGKASLPPKAVLLSFDDGFTSFYTRVFPLLKQYQFPAVIALVGKFMETDKDSVQYTLDQKLPRKAFLTWNQVQEMQESGLVEVCSHSYGLHRELPSNRQGNFLPSATTFYYDSTKKRNETLAEYTNRILTDLVKSRNDLFQHTGRYPLAVVWPYGRYSDITNQLAAKAGFNTMLNLNSKPNLVGSKQLDINRFYITYNANTDALRDLLNQRTYQPVYRFLAPGIPILIGEDRDSAETLLSALVRQAALSRPNAIIIPLFYKPNDLSWHTYFPNAELPYRNVNMNRLIWQMQSRAGTDVFLLWDANRWTSILPTREKQMAFFGALGKQAPARGVVLKDSLLSQWIWQHHAELPGLSANFDRRNMRDFILDKTKDSAASSGLAALNIFEQFQADQKIFLQAQLAQSEWMKDSSFSKKLLATFNGVIFDLSHIPTKDLLVWLRHLELSPLWYGRMGVLLPPTSQRQRKKISRLMVAQKIIHWGYGIDDLNDIYKWELPINTAVTTN